MSGYRLARAYREHGDIQRARETLDAVIALGPKWPAVWNLLAEIVWDTTNPTEAIEAWQHSLELNPEQPRIRLALGEALRREGRISQARVLLADAATAGVGEAHYLLATIAFSNGELSEARNQLVAYFATSTSGPSRQAALALQEKVNERIYRRQVVGGSISGIALFSALVLGFRIHQKCRIEDLLAVAPESAHDLARILAAIRHEVLKHNTTLLDEMAHALEHGDHHAVAWGAARLFGDSEREGVVDQFSNYIAQLERLGRRHGLRLDLRRRDPVLAPMWKAMRRLQSLQRRLRRSKMSSSLQVELRSLSVQLNVEAYQALGTLIRKMGTVMIDPDLFHNVEARVRAEPGLDNEVFPDLEIIGPALLVRAFRGDLENIFANLMRNAMNASLPLSADERKLTVKILEEDDPVTGLEHVVLRFCDNAPGELTNAMIHGRSIGRGLGLTVDLITRHDGSITVESEPGWAKAVVVRLLRAEDTTLAPHQPLTVQTNP